MFFFIYLGSSNYREGLHLRLYIAPFREGRNGYLIYRAAPYYALSGLLILHLLAIII